jgi:hypothetical protein
VASQPDELRSRIKLVQASATDFELKERFGAVIIPFRPFQHLVPVPR